MPRFRFADFVLSPRQRLLLRAGREEPLIPRYFDLLVFLVEHRHEAVHRQVIFDRVWIDVVVSDSALSQAVRTLRRTLGDNSREPIYIRTVARHGYQFVFPAVVEEPDEGSIPAVSGLPGPKGPGLPMAHIPDPVGRVLSDPASPIGSDPVSPVSSDPPVSFDRLLDRVTAPLATAMDEEDAREAAELLHGLGTAETLHRLGLRTRHAQARALLRDTRWDVANAGDVPVFGHPAPFAVSAAIAHLRLRQAARIAAGRWAGAAAGAGLAGAVAGALGGVLLAAAPGSQATLTIAPVLSLLGALSGALGGAGTGAGLSVAESVARSQRTLASVLGGALGGTLAGCGAQFVGRWSLSGLVGLHVSVNGCMEGATLGAAAGLGYALSTHPAGGGLAAPRGALRFRAALVTALTCGLAALGLTLTHHALVGGTIHDIAQAASGAQAILTPLGALIGEPGFGPVTRALIGTGEGALFGFGLTLGLTRRPAA